MTAEERGAQETGSVTVRAELDAFSQVSEFVEERLERAACPMRIRVQILVAVEELFVNIVNYAYPGKRGDITAEFWLEGGKEPMVCIRLSDYGAAFNPWTYPEPDITLAAEDRKVGGLGIYMVKKTMDDVEYEYKDGRNIVEIKRKLKD
jgi:anti-sigma regulatory factor (Ser/Thr protein kinase)